MSSAAPIVELERRGADRVRERGGQLHVGARLDGEQGADEKQEGDGEGLHDALRSIDCGQVQRSSNLTAVKLITCRR